MNCCMLEIKVGKKNKWKKYFGRKKIQTPFVTKGNLSKPVTVKAQSPASRTPKGNFSKV